MAQYVVHCQAAPSGVAVAPCGAPGGVAYEPVLVLVDEQVAILSMSAPELFAWSFVIVAGCWLTGFVVGSIMRVIRAA